ncbi:acyl carrier protein [Chimaeribacter arupi]|uniref:acyl carrier protein n=1 Tax=Chimaeribacter arupi TaxID=2060066 RepID=UPI000C7C3E6A|nr:acyl carrier protein [Chimaeribacter arupi]PLR46660.1 acyl carrier protein [Chimaeribacter arupi]PLR52846.1 acyl carrier protein [Chimaeribacter arupi]WKZ94607.1 acyl carrier protein [Chimaeribacter arupi]
MTDYTTLYTTIADTLCDAKDLDPATLDADMPLAALKLDSLDYVELMVLLKREFGLTLEADLFVQNPGLTLRQLCQHFAGEEA